MKVSSVAVALAVGFLVLSALAGPVAGQPETSIFELPSLIGAMGLPKGTETSLLAKADAAIAAYETGWPDDLTVLHHLEALSREIDVQAGKGIPVAVAVFLREIVERLLVDLGTPIITCSIEGVDFFSTTIEACGEIGGAVQECVPPAKDRGEGEGKPSTSASQNHTETDPLGPEEGWLTNLSNAVTASGIANASRYSRGTYTCVNFAHDMQVYLNGLGYTTSFTIFYKKDARTGKINTGHAVVDVHAPDGTVVFLEPQNGDYLNLDFDGDGGIEVATGHASGPTSTWPMTDDDVRIEVYKDKAAAKKAGAPVK